MDRKWCSIKEIQKLARLSPGALQELLQRNKKQLTLEVKTDDMGKKELYMDHGSLERIIFLKQLVLGEEIGLAETCLQLRKWGNSRSDEPPKLSPLEETLNLVEQEVLGLKSKFHRLLVKYNQVLRDLSHCRSDNSMIRKELAIIRKSHQALLEQIQKGPDLPLEDSTGTIN